MGEQQSDGGRTGRRRAHPGDPAPAAGFEALLAASLRAGHLDDEAERRAVHAFRAARDAGAHRARTRRRDDWRPRGRRGAGRSLKTALSVLLAGFTLGGVAFAAIGGTDSSSRGAGHERRPASSPAAPGQEDTGSAASSSPSASASADRPAAARDTEARCRAYQQVKERGKSLEATAWQRLVDVAGGEKKVDGYCARKLTEAEAGATSRGTSGGAPAAPEIPATPAAPDLPVDPATKAPVNPTGAAPTTPTAPDGDGVTEDVGGAGDSRPDTAADPDAGKDSARN